MLPDRKNPVSLIMTPPTMPGLPTRLRYAKGAELPSREWDQLEEGHRVIVQRDGLKPFAGEVDAVTHDASVFWVWLDGGRGRIAVYVDEGTRVWLPRGDRLRATEEPAGAHATNEALEPSTP